MGEQPDRPVFAEQRVLWPGNDDTEILSSIREFDGAQPAQEEHLRYAGRSYNMYWSLCVKSCKFAIV